VIQQVRLFFVAGSTAVIDYTASYLVLGYTYVNGPCLLSLDYSYQFMAAAGAYPYPSSQGYSIGSPLNLLLFDSATTTYSRTFNPLDLNFRQPGGNCRAASTDLADGGNLASIRFGVNSIFSCVGTSSTLLQTNLVAAFNYVGSFGISSTNLLDYVSLTETASASN
jgi:hypothetical protein